MEPFSWLPEPKYSAEDVRGIALGAPYQAMEWHDRGAETRCDDFDYRIAKFANRRGLKKAWGLADGADALATMRMLLDGMHAPDMDAMMTMVAAFRYDDIPVKQEAINRIGAEHGAPAAQAAAEFFAALDRPTMPEQLPSSTYAWDLSRMAMLGRRSIALGWLTPQDVLPLLHEGVARSRGVFSGWPEYGASFAVGRALWCADEGPKEVDESLELTKPVLHVLFTDQASPWLRLPW